MTRVTVRAARRRLFRLIAEVEAGADVVIVRAGVPVARLVPVTPPPVRRVFGALAGRVEVGPAFFEPLADDEMDAWHR
jgi:prevent-host-death family protein